MKQPLFIVIFLMGFCFLLVRCECKGCMALCVSVHIVGRATKEKSICVCQKNNMELIKGTAW